MLGLTVCSLFGLIGIAAGDKLHFKEKNFKSIGSQFRKMKLRVGTFFAQVTVLKIKVHTPKIVQKKVA